MTVPAAPDAPRQIILLCDGTNNNLTGTLRDTNLVKLSELLTASPDERRLVFYDPGVGNPGALPGATTWTQLKRRLERINGLAFGHGIYENVAEAYLFLMRHYQAGDQLYILGFSRGAFAARCVGGLVNQFGILQPHMESMVHTLLHWYFAERTDQQVFQQITQQITRQFAGQASREVEVHFTGVWDTVASVGLPPFNAKFTASSDLSGKRFLHTRQALALDEHRKQFSPRLYASRNGPIRTALGHQGSLKQLWFPGAHCDVGGGYEAGAAGLSEVALAWLVSEAVLCGLRLAGEHGPLSTEARVIERLRACHYPRPPDRVDRVSSELRTTALWALTGMTVRQSNWVPAGHQLTVLATGLDPVKARPGQVYVPAENHPSVEQPGRRNSAWDEARTPWQVWAALAAWLVVVLLQGLLLQTRPLAELPWSELPAAVYAGLAGPYLDLQAWWRWWPGLGSSSLDALRQLTWFNAFEPVVRGAPVWPRSALLLDLAQVACQALVLSWWAARAFARLAGLRRANDPARPWLNALGWALPLAILPDVVENILLWLAWGLAAQDLPRLAWATHALTGLVALAKCTGLVAVLVLIGLGWIRRLRSAGPA